MKRFMGGWTLAIKSIGLVSQFPAYIPCRSLLRIESVLLSLLACGWAKKVLLCTSHAVARIFSRKDLTP